MAIQIRSAAGLSVVEPTSYQGESELEAAIAATPTLVQKPGDPPLALVACQTSLPDTGRLDVLLVDAAGLPVVVEVKLASNGESRRQIVAQVVDYVASLTQFTVDELDALVDGRLETALRSFDGEGSEDDTGFEARWRAVGVNLRAGLARFVLALDEAPDDLVRIVRFLAQHSNLDVRLVTVAKYSSPEVGVIHVPQSVVAGADAFISGGRPEPRLSRPELAEVVAAYDKDAAPEMRTYGSSSRYRQIRPPNWPQRGRVHYEFIQSRDTIGVDLHLEDALAAQLAPRLRPFAGRSIGPLDTRIEWDQSWNKNRGRLTARFPLSTPAEPVAASMVALVLLTSDEVRAGLQQ